MQGFEESVYLFINIFLKRPHSNYSHGNCIYLNIRYTYFVGTVLTDSRIRLQLEKKSTIKK